jgi:hypothetical protein
MTLGFVILLAIHQLPAQSSAHVDHPSIMDATLNHFSGSGDANWFNSNNWSLGTIPTSAEHAVIDSGKTVILGDNDGSSLTITPTQNTRALTISANATLTVAATNSAETALLIGNNAGADTVLFVNSGSNLNINSSSEFAIRLMDNSSERLYVDGVVSLNNGRGIGVKNSNSPLPVNRQSWSTASTLNFGISAADFQAQDYGNLVLNLSDTLIINNCINIWGDLTINSGTFAFIEGEISGVHAVVYGDMYVKNDAFVRTCMPHSGYNTFTLHGDIDVDSTAWFSSTAGMFVELDSDESQMLCERITLLRKLKLRGTGDKGLSSDLDVTDSLVLEDGELNTNGHMVTIGTGPDHIGSLVTSDETASKRVGGHFIKGKKKGKVKGKLARWIPANKTKTLKFPVSSASGSRDIEVTITTGNEGGRLVVEFHETVPIADGLPMFDNDGRKIKNIVESGYWTIKPISGLSGSTYSVDLVFSNNKKVDYPEDLRVIKRPDAAYSWDVPGEHVISYTNSNGEFVARRKNLVGFSDFTIAATESQTLPVNLTFFEVDLADKNLPELIWNTGTEQENYGFHIERKKGSSSDSSWTEIDFVRGFGTSTQQHSYRYQDETIVQTGTYHYQLVQEDYDGVKTNYGPVSITIKNALKTCISSVSPNPFNPVTNINITISNNSRVTLSVYNILGQLVEKLIDREMAPGNYPVVLNGQRWSSGQYIVVLTSDGLKESRMITMLK